MPRLIAPSREKNYDGALDDRHRNIIAEPALKLSSEIDLYTA